MCIRELNGFDMKKQKSIDQTTTLGRLTTLMQALGDENRLRIINLLLAREELCVCDIQSVLNMPQTRVSRHLTILKNADLVTARRDGRWMYYALRRDTAAAGELCALCEALFPNVPGLASDINALKTASGLVCCTVPISL